MTVPSISLEKDVINSMVASKTFSDNTEEINSVSYSQDGVYMITSANDDSINIYNIQSGVKSRSVNSKKYGVGLIRYAPGANCAVHCSTKIDNTIRYLSLHDNKYLRYFIGHNDRVTCLSMTPAEDMFLSAAHDKTIRLWDLKTANCQGVLHSSSNPIAAFDPEGLIFAAGMDNTVVKLYDLRSFDKGPFISFQMTRENMFDWTDMKFSPCGKFIMLNTKGTMITLLDAFTGKVKHHLYGHENVLSKPLEASFTPCSKYVFSPSSDRHIYVWSVETGELVTKLPTDHDQNFHIAQFNPRFFVLATSCTKLHLWSPGEDFPFGDDGFARQG
ncbi:unnamed protein product [Caenorhabditis auriculariae]|uniref:WD repeat-containing protein 82 n=1 Tax=Caenorhabditis auriculariae TaxID=2777116 RepID=A0A8S1HJV4_9PELO|nr:unnamed protein product [Caenorhabditis auriculariae]